MVDAHDRIDVPLIGRERELALMSDAFDSARRQRRCHVCRVIGTAGIGKSRLALELARTVSPDGALLLSTHCAAPVEGTTVSTQPLDDLLRQLPRRPREILAAAEHAELIVERLHDGRVEDGLWAMRRLLESLAGERPLILVLEDLQWATPTFVRLMEHVLERSWRAPILLVCLARSDLSIGRGSSAASTIMPARLSAAQCDQLIDRLAGGSGMDAGTRRAIREAAQGVPLFVEQALADGALRDPFAVPPDIDSLLRDRIDRLDAAARETLQRAAVQGQRFDVRALRGLTPPGLRPDLSHQLRSLRGRRLISDDRFHHQLVWAITVATMSPTLRAGLHRRFADWLVREGAGDDLVGYHLEQASRRQPSLRAAAGLRLLAAGRRAQSRADMDAAPDLLGRAARLLPPDSAVHRDVLPDLAACLAEAASSDRAGEAISTGLALAGRTGDRRLAARLLVEREMLRLHIDPAVDTLAALRAIEGAAEALEVAGDDRGLSRALFVQGTCTHWLGRAQAGLRIMERAIDCARRAGDRRAEIDAIWQLTGPLYFGPTPAGAAIQRCRGLATQVPPRSQADAFMVVLQSVFTAMLGRADEARALARRAEAMYEELGVSQEDVGVPHYTCRLEMLTGNLEGAVSMLRTCCRVSEERAETGYLATSAGMLAEALYRVGRYDDAVEATSVSERTASPDDFISHMLWRSVRAKVLARRGEHDAARRLGTEAVAIGEPTDYLFARADSLYDLAEVNWLAGSCEDSAAAARRAHTLYRQKGDVVSTDRTEKLLARAG